MYTTLYNHKKNKNNNNNKNLSFPAMARAGNYVLRTICLGYFFVNVPQARVICEEATSIKKMFLSDWPVGKPEGCFLD